VSKTVTVTATATDNIGIAKIELYKDGVLVVRTVSAGIRPMIPTVTTR
jgi:hypothetical protein